eukprot:scaffold2900_cov30-Tisochrysis_lutea.AAC.1
MACNTFTSATTDEPCCSSSPGAQMAGTTLERSAGNSMSGSAGAGMRCGKKACSSGAVYRRTRAWLLSVSSSIDSRNDSDGPATPANCGAPLRRGSTGGRASAAARSTSERRGEGKGGGEDSDVPALAHSRIFM